MKSPSRGTGSLFDIVDDLQASKELCDALTEKLDSKLAGYNKSHEESKSLDASTIAAENLDSSGQSAAEVCTPQKRGGVSESSGARLADPARLAPDAGLDMKIRQEVRHQLAGQRPVENILGSSDAESERVIALLHWASRLRGQQEPPLGFAADTVPPPLPSSPLRRTPPRHASPLRRISPTHASPPRRASPPRWKSPLPRFRPPPVELDLNYPPAERGGFFYASRSTDGERRGPVPI